ncbi:ABC transporter family substrate-binding protein [Georgenia sp. TF02-10]|uniref:ABC transporter family substrate-binding protein n=1 Tax=Georgenia sp. TF02-10 TaxID=2917725 RepID=UPI001FA6CB60|nr:ABC transporter family substrate-binding protein [Georgenia sp. TF02-10]UNX55663.1 ABC transporter family substrate-binding protein [Georgenia sp. TF02-10]
MRTTKGSAVLATGAALALVLGACSTDGGGDGDDDGGGQSGAGGAEGSAGVITEGDGDLFDVNATPREELEQGGQLRRAVAELPPQWNPMQVNGNQSEYTEVRDAITTHLFDYDGAAQPTPNENYLRDFEDEMDGDQQVITLHLNPEAVWNSGDPITWEDYEASLTVCNAEDPEYQCVQTGPYEQVESVTQGETEFDVVIRFKSTYPDWSSIVDQVYPAEGLVDATTFNEGWLEFRDEWFTGPYRVDNIDQAQQVLTLVPNENWWGPEPMLDEIQFRVVAAEATGTAFQNGEIDVFDVGADPNAYQLAQTVGGAELRQTLGPDWRHFTFNSTAGLLQDLTVRQAIARSIDRQAIAESDLAGMPEELIGTLNNHIFMEGQEGYQDNAQGFEHDPDRAAADLEEAGWVLNESTGIREKDGQPLTVKFAVLTGVPVSENEGQLAQAQLKEVGINLELQQVAIDDFSRTLDEGDFEIIGFSWIGTPYPMANLDQIYGDPATNSSNYAKLNNPELNELFDQIATETDHDRRIELANEADTMIWESVHTLPLYQRPDIAATVSNLANFGAMGFSTTRAENWGFTAQ